jgi:ribosomal protein L30/L7E
VGKGKVFDRRSLVGTPEEIAQSYRTLNLEQVYATILYYLHNQEAVSKYLADWMEFAHQQRKAQELNPPPALVWLRQELAKRKQTSEEQVAIQK